MATYKPNIPNGFKSEKDLNTQMQAWKRQQVFQYLTGNYRQDLNFLYRLRDIQAGRK